MKGWGVASWLEVAAIGVSVAVLAGCTSTGTSREAADAVQRGMDAASSPRDGRGTDAQTGGPRFDASGSDGKGVDAGAAADGGDAGGDVDAALGDGRGMDAAVSWEPMPSEWVVDAGEVRLSVRADPLSWRVERDGAVVVASAEPAWRLAVPVGDSAPEAAFYPPIDNPWPVAWYAAARATGLRPRGDGGADLRVEFEPEGDVPGGGGLEAVLSVSLEGTTASLDLDSAAAGAVLDEALVAVGGDEQFYGLGETYDSVAQRGFVRPMYMALGKLESGTNEAHVPVPFLVSTSGWGLFVPSRRAGAFDVAATREDAVAVRFEGGVLPLRVFGERDPLDAIADYVESTGHPALPPRWAFAPQWWHNEWKDATELLDGAHTLRDLDIPTGVVWIDNPWQQHYNDHLFVPSKFPDPAAMMNELTALGYRVIAWSTPYVEDALQPEHDEMAAAGFFVDAGGHFVDTFGFGDLVDLTSPAARDAFGALVANATAAGIVGFKLDYGEEVLPGLLGVRLGWHFANGETEATEQSAFQIAYHSLYAGVLKDAGVDGFLLVRGGTWGDQVYATTVWPGDLCSGFQVPGEGKGHVGGLPAAVAAGLSLSASGYPFFASDIGGFRHGRPTERVLLRWAAAAAVAPVMQLGGGGANHDPFDFGAYGAAPEHGDDSAGLTSQYGPATVDAYRKFARLHTALFPWLYTLSERAAQTGAPVTTPFGLAHPETGWHPSDAYFVGDVLLVAPEVHGDDARDVPLPAGRWVDWWTGEAFDGPDVVVRDTPLDEVPMYVRGGGIVPMFDEVPDALVEAAAPGVTGLGPGESWRVRVRAAVPASDAEHHVQLYDGTLLSVARQGETLELGVQLGEEVDGVTWDLWWRAGWPGLERAPGSVHTGEVSIPQIEPGQACEPPCWWWDETASRLVIEMPQGPPQLVAVEAVEPAADR